MENNLKEEFFRKVTSCYSDDLTINVTKDFMELSEKFEIKFNKKFQDFTLSEANEILEEYRKNTNSSEKKDQFFRVLKTFFDYCNGIL